MIGFKKFFSYVIPSILAFTLSGVYAIVSGFFVGNSVGNIGLSTINIAYPIVALIQALGVGVGMGGAVYFSIKSAGKNEREAREYISGTLWLLIITSVITTATLLLLASPILKAFGASGELLSLGEQYLYIICLGAPLQIMSVGLVPLIRNSGGVVYAMIVMVVGFVVNIFLDYLFIWEFGWNVKGAALATVVGELFAFIGVFAYLIYKNELTFKIRPAKIIGVFRNIIKIGIAPFGVTLTPNFSLILINRFSVTYGGDESIAVYACISYVISIVYLVLQGVGDGSQPLISQSYGAKSYDNLRRVVKLAYGFSLVLSAAGIIGLFIIRWDVGVLLGASPEVVYDVAKVFPIFLLAIPFIAINRITAASFYATEKSGLSYILSYAEPVLMLILLLILPRYGGQMMVWWSVTIARILAAALAIFLKVIANKYDKASI